MKLPIWVIGICQTRPSLKAGTSISSRTTTDPQVHTACGSVKPSLRPKAGFDYCRNSLGLSARLCNGVMLRWMRHVLGAYWNTSSTKVLCRWKNEALALQMKVVTAIGQSREGKWRRHKNVGMKNQVPLSAIIMNKSQSFHPQPSPGSLLTQLRNCISPSITFLFSSRASLCASLPRLLRLPSKGFQCE